MKKTFKLMAALVMGAGMMFSCQQAEEPMMDNAQEPVVETRAYGDKTPTVTIYVETNDVNPLNAGDYKLPNGKPYADIVEFFASNIHKRTVNGVVEPTLYLNDKMTNLLENGGAATYVQGLQAKGIKVVLTVLGDWQGIGVANMNDTQTTQFAKILAHAVEKYGLDGIGFDDEYSNSPDLSNPWVTSPSGEAASRLLYETKKAMPDKTVMVYYLGAIYSNSIVPVDGVLPGEYVDYAVADYGQVTAPMQGMTLKQCAGMSIELNRGSGDSSESLARQQKEAGYGYYMFFALGHTTSLVSDFADYKRQVGRCQTVARGLYDEELLMPEYYYAKDDATRRPLP